MPHADILTVVHHDDTRTTYTDVRYQLHRTGVRIWTQEQELDHTDILMSTAYRHREGTSR